MTTGRPGGDPTRPGHLTILIRAIAIFARFCMRSLARIRVEGAVDRIPRRGPLIIAVNHLSNADGVVVGGWLTPALGRRIHWLAKREMLEWPVVGPIARAGSIHPVDRGAADIEAFRLAQRILEAGNVLVLFPEGTRSRTGGLQRPREGLALLALRTGAPILPVGLAGTDRFWPRGSYPHPGARITMRVGEAFTLAEALGGGARDRRAAKVLGTEVIMRRIAALLPPRYRGVYLEPAAEEADAEVPLETPPEPSADE